MKMAGINFYAPVPRVRSESLPACPRPRDNGESLVRIDGLDARIRYAASYRAAGIACAPQGCWVREGVVPLLQQALGLLPEDYSLLIFDAYRPLAVQQALYEEYSALVRRSILNIRRSSLPPQWTTLLRCPTPTLPGRLLMPPAAHWI